MDKREEQTVTEPTGEKVGRRSPGNRRTRRAGGERGTAMVEFSIIVLMLTSLIFGAIEMSLAWGDTLVLDQASRSAARAAARLTNDPQSDREALRSLVANFEPEDLAQIEFVVIYEAQAGGTMPASCMTVSGSDCNHYPAAALAELNNDTRWGCGPAALDGSWCPSNRDPQLQTPVNLGVYVEARRSWITSSLPGGGIDLSSDTVMRLDPLVR